MNKLTILLLMLALFVGCSARPMHSQAVVRMYFGLSISPPPGSPAGTPPGQVTAAQFDEFVTASIVPRFPDGMTILNAQGRWRAKDGTPGAEESRVVEIAVDGDGQAQQSAIHAIAAEYGKQFRQQSVLVVVLPATVEFIATDAP